MDIESEQQPLNDRLLSSETSFGHRLKTARTERNISINDVARALRLDSKIIEALENERHEQLPATAFVCGYIRNYARFLQVQPEPLVEQYKRERNEIVLEPKLKTSQNSGIHKSGVLPSIVLPISLVLFLIVLLFGVWQLWGFVSTRWLNHDIQQEQSNPSLPDSLKSEQADDDPGSLALPEPTSSYTAPPVKAVPIHRLKDNQLLVTEDALLAESATDPPVNPIASVASTRLDSAQAESANSQTVDEPINSIQEESPERVDTIVPADEPEDRLLVSFSGSSWVSIRDGDNTLLSSGIMRAGKVLSLKGKLPYKVFLGDARHVAISFNGKTFDHSHYINRKNVARFKVQ